MGKSWRALSSAEQPIRMGFFKVICFSPLKPFGTNKGVSQIGEQPKGNHAAHDQVKRHGVFL